MPQGRTGQIATPPAIPTPTSSPTQTTAPPPAVGSQAELCALPAAFQAQATLRGAIAARDQVENWVGELKSSRARIAETLRNGNSAEGADRNGLNERLGQMDKQIVGAETKLVEANNAVITASAVPCAVAPPQPRQPRSGPPEELFVLGALFICFVMFPIAIAYSRRIWRRSAKVVMGIPAELTERLNRLEESVDSVAIEVERVGEGQRFVTNLFIEGGPQMLNAGPMNTLEIKERERVEAERHR